MNLTNRETATVLAALRYWQRDFGAAGGATAFPDHFYDCKPLKAKQIDALCERINAPDEEEFVVKLGWTANDLREDWKAQEENEDRPFEPLTDEEMMHVIGELECSEIIAEALGEDKTRVFDNIRVERGYIIEGESFA